MEEKIVLPIDRDQFETLVGQAHGFVAAKLSQPFASVEVDIVSQAELARSLEEMIAEVKELTGKEGQGSRFLSDALKYGEAKLTSSLVALLSKRILGLYTQSYKDDRPGRLLLVGQNIKQVAEELDLDTREFFLWVLIHETMHIAQFNSPGSYLRESIKEKIIQVGKDGSQTKQLMQEASALMTWVEGSADAMMDEPGLLTRESIEKMRQSIEERRNHLSWSTVLLQLLTRKNRQYRQGRYFSETVAKKYGIEAMALIINERRWLPTREEIRAPSLWIQRFEKAFPDFPAKKRGQ